MPIYEFYCADCHTVFSFFSSRVDTESAPACPRCGKGELPRKPSTFATLKHGGGKHGGGSEGDGDLLDGDELFEGLDEERLEGAMESILGELEGGSEGDDPRQLARLLRRFGDAAGVEPGPKMEELLGRLDAGEDPEGVEQALGDDLEDDDLADFFRRKRRKGGDRAAAPAVDDELYFL